MINPATCYALFRGACATWGLTEAEHALAHAMGQLIDEVDPHNAEISSDGKVLARILDEQGYRVVPKDDA